MGVAEVFGDGEPWLTIAGGDFGLDEVAVAVGKHIGGAGVASEAGEDAAGGEDKLGGGTLQNLGGGEPVQRDGFEAIGRGGLMIVGHVGGVEAGVEAALDGGGGGRLPDAIGVEAGGFDMVRQAGEEGGIGAGLGGIGTAGQRCASVCKGGGFGVWAGRDEQAGFLQRFARGGDAGGGIIIGQRVEAMGEAGGARGDDVGGIDAAAGEDEGAAGKGEMLGAFGHEDERRAGWLIAEQDDGGGGDRGHDLTVACLVAMCSLRV